MALSLPVVIEGDPSSYSIGPLMQHGSSHALATHLSELSASATRPMETIDTFSETGLPMGQCWSVNVDGTPHLSVTTITGATILPITVTNPYANATPVPLQLRISFSHSLLVDSNGSERSAYVLNASCHYLPAWIQDAGSASSNATCWARLNSAIPPVSRLALFIVSVPMGTYLTNSQPAGEAPNLTSPYGALDNGGDVFTQYWNFLGSVIPTDWTVGLPYTQHDGITVRMDETNGQGTSTKLNTTQDLAFDFQGTFHITDFSPGLMASVGIIPGAFLGIYSSQHDLALNIRGINVPTNFTPNSPAIYTIYSDSHSVGVMQNYGDRVVFNGTGLQIGATLQYGFFAQQTSNDSISCSYMLTRTILPRNGMLSVSAGQAELVSSSSIIVNEIPGIHQFTVAQVGPYAPKPSQGVVDDSSSPAAITIAFWEPEYPLTIHESGLASSTLWHAEIDSLEFTSSNSTLVLYLPNGSYTIDIPVVGSKFPNPYLFTVALSGSPQTFAISFGGARNSMLGTSVYIGSGATSPVTGVGAIVATFIAVWTKRRLVRVRNEE
ncbi:MAG: hypothetical protein ACREDK_03365 [Thermoplasmata archaeon]